MNFIVAIIFIIAAVTALLIILFSTCDHLFYSSFFRRALQVKNEAGIFDSSILTEADLLGIPLPVAGFIKFSRLEGKKRISSVHVKHSGTFRPAPDKEFTAITGEYFITTKRPSFCWFGRISVAPGIKVSAFDSYFNGKGRMLIKLLSFFKIADERTQEASLSALGRCMAEMTLAPSFFLNKEMIRWTYSDNEKAFCTVEDAGLKVNTRLYFNPDSSLDRVEVDRLYDKGNGKFSTEKFTGRGSMVKDFNGIRLSSVVDGYWNLAEGDLHYVHFVVDEVEME